MTVSTQPDTDELSSPRAPSDPATRAPETVGDGVLSVRSLSKSYGHRVAVEDVSFEVGLGVTALLGPNGAGKTTIIRCLTGLQSWNRGPS